MKLLSMTEFVKARKLSGDISYNDAIAAVKRGDFAVASEMATCADNFVACLKYAHFLSQPIKLEMFAPVDKNGQVLPEVKLELRDSEQEAAHRYLEAMGKVLFKDLDIEYTDITKKIIIKKKNGFFVITGAKKNFGGNLTIEDLVHRDMELTDNALKLIGV